MKLDFTSMIELIFPLSDDERLLKELTPVAFAHKLNMQCDNSIYSLASFKDKSVRAAVHLNKFHGNAKAQALLSSLVTAWLVTLPPEHYLLIPIPLGSSRERKRGYNQVTQVLRYALKDADTAQLCTNVLYKTKDTDPQTSLSKTQRLINLKDVFAVTGKGARIIKGKHVIVVDDVSTTGTTLQEAYKTLLPYGPLSIKLISFAH